ncbi:sigma 54 modulation/S30EA ribosomal C-terminal domain-containing protein [Streptomyces sp. RB6PN25]|uniref:Sigma 54 modulation/S30EA ribosomal C-terminal domain-containing protein n=1 Tax=Streptomyces humicola TaxID=2953240 RepID=A0ABT1Q1U8_9ACTN|nr:sigma 54 modulation/S30EA ribosomal C-terminal domain-containing protein [Streptomyces humicola]MCQ4083886.1 sigma 54 modulation/S30EA ribosomal C-terminal domain-containing protein [Streptomyces humicola]
MPLTLSTIPARAMTLEQAKRWLETSGYPFVFFADATGRGNVLYHRYDGCYGLVTPVEQQEEKPP